MQNSKCEPLLSQTSEPVQTNDQSAIEDIKTSKKEAVKKAVSSSDYRGSYHSFIPIDEKNHFPAFVLASLVFQLILFILVGALTVGFLRLAFRPVPTLVQLTDGRAIKTRPGSHLERTPEVIHKFVSDMGSLLFNWAEVYPAVDEQGEPLFDKNGKQIVNRDLGMPVGAGDELRVTTPLWEASFALTASDNYRQTFLQQTASVQHASFWGKQLEVIWEISQLSEPELIEPGKWKITAIANCLYLNREQGTRQINACNKEFYLQAIDTPSIPLPQTATPLQQIVYRAREANLEIYLIKDL